MKHPVRGDGNCVKRIAPGAVGVETAAPADAQSRLSGGFW